MDYNGFSKEELIKIIKKQEIELKAKKYGLVWDSEREPEQVVLDCENNLPVLERIKDKIIKTNDSEDNILIMGDNYHALTVLNYTHKEMADVIYIDPPYNTGNKDFIYNDKYVEKEDGYRHSKWLNFIEKRLNIAKNLLKSSGVIFLSINEDEQAQLKLLCDKIFGASNYLTMFTIKVRHEDRILKGDKDFHEVVEYLYLYRKSTDFNIIKRVYDNTSNSEYVYEIYEKSKGTEILFGNKKSILFKPDEYQIIKGKPSNTKLKKINIRGSIKEGNSSGRFFMKFLEDKIGKENGFLYKIPNIGDDGLGYRYFLLSDNKNRVNGDYFQGVPENRADIKEVPYPNFFDFEYDFNNVGYEGGIVFRNGKKPVNFILKCLELGGAIKNSNAIILDFFAGSGTTGHAVLELNKQDSGNRKFILCTNNENNICEDVTYHRLEKVIKGYNKNGNGEFVEGLGGNLQFFKTDLIKKTINRDQVKIDLTNRCTEMLCVKENIFDIFVENDDFKIFQSNKKDRYLCIYYNFIDETFDDFLIELGKLDGNKYVYMFSTSNDVDKSLYRGIKNCIIQAIPQEILDVYRDLIKLNIPINKETLILDFNKSYKKIYDDKDKDEGARILRIVLEKIIQKIAYLNNVNYTSEKGKELKTSVINDNLKNINVINQVLWEENKTYLTIGNHAAHGEYNEYDEENIKLFYKHIQKLLDLYNI